MAKNSITDYSKTASLNTDIQSVDIDEGCLPSGINNAIRELMADLAAMNDGTVSLTSPSFSSVNIDAGTIDGTVIGGTTPAAGTFTTGQFNTSLNVDGTVTADGLTVEAGNNPITFSTADSGYIKVTHPTRGGDYRIRPSGTTSERLDIQNGTQKLARFSSSGDISFYEDTGTTAKLFWDASAERLGIGTSSPANKLEVSGAVVALGAATAYTNTGLYIQNKGSSVFDVGAWRSGASVAELTFSTDSGSDAAPTERMRIDSSGNVGIGISSPQAEVHLHRTGSSESAIRFTNGITGSTSSDGLRVGLDINEDGVIWMHDNEQILFGTNNTERMRIDSSGNVLVGTTTSIPAGASQNVTGIAMQSDGQLQVSADGQFAGAFNRKTSDGDILEFRKNGITAGGIDVIGTEIAVHSSSGASGIRFNPNGTLPTNGSGSITDNTYDLGQSGIRWDDVYATNGTIQTSDQNEKQDIEALSEAEQRVAVAAKGLLRKFRWIDSVEEKGDDARIHFGIIAQDLQAAFEAEGLDAGRYAMFINSTWTDEETGEERSRMGVRYNQLLAFIIAAI